VRLTTLFPAGRHDRGMTVTEQAVIPAPTRVPLLFLTADTGGGHRNAAEAVARALDVAYPGRFAPAFCDPLGGPGSARLLRWVTGLYGPVIRRAPWLWGAVYYACDSRVAMGALRRTLLRLADRATAHAVKAHRPAAIVSFHPLTGPAAVAARDLAAPGVPVVTVVTDLVSLHAAWRYGGVDLTIAPAACTAGHRPPPGPDQGRWAVVAGPPVARDLRAGPLRERERTALRRSLGLPENGLVILLTGGGEGSGGLARRAAAIVRRFADVRVVVVCGRNVTLRRRLERLATRSGGRLTVTGFVHDMADWLRCCDLVVTKAGPGTIAEATCCGTPLLLTSHVPGQEKGNAEFVAGAGAGRHVPGVRPLLAEIGRLRHDQAAVEAMRSASVRLGRPAAGVEIAELIAGLVRVRPSLAAMRPARGPA
jgi:1,2-diacylglycerol 3-beta-galactosyltransferase